MARRVNAGRRRVAGMDPQEILGFSTVYVVAEDFGDNPITTQSFAARFTEAMRSRGIDWSQPNDQLDLSRDLLITEAIGPGYEWEIVNGELRIWPEGYTFDWDTTRRPPGGVTLRQGQHRPVASRYDEDNIDSIVADVNAAYDSLYDVRKRVQSLPAPSLSALSGLADAAYRALEDFLVKAEWEQINIYEIED